MASSPSKMQTNSVRQLGHAVDESGFAEGSFGAVLHRECENVMRVRTPDLLGVLSRNTGSV
jgi:hypothetical protein